VTFHKKKIFEFETFPVRRLSYTIYVTD